MNLTSANVRPTLGSNSDCTTQYLDSIYLVLVGVVLDIPFFFPGFHSSAFEYFTWSVIRHKIFHSVFLRNSSP